MDAGNETAANTGTALAGAAGRSCKRPRDEFRLLKQLKFAGSNVCFGGFTGNP